jgi:sigma-B regulation protein RsbQ
LKQEILERNNVKVLGSGTRTLMLAHGFGCDQNMWRFFVPAFESHFRIVLFDYVGSGASDVSAYSAERYSSLDGYTHDVLDIVDALEFKDLIFVGHSVSAMIGLLAAIQRPECFAQLIMIGPSPCYINDPGYIGGFDRSDIDELLKMMDKNYMGWAHAMAPSIMQNSDNPQFSLELEASFCSTDPVIARQFAKATFLSDNRKDLADFSIPTLIMQCSEDLIAPPEVGDFLKEALPNSILVKMKATGHCPHLSHPEETISIIRDYLGG